MSKKLILVPTNFSTQAEVALKQSVMFAGRYEAEVVLMHVIPSLKKLDGNSDTIDSIQTKLQKLVDLMRDISEVRISTRIDTGKVVSQILIADKELNPEYVFIGTDVSSKPYSSMTLKIINEVACPVVVFTGRFDKSKCDKIVLPLDLTKETKQKIEQTVNIAKVYKSEVHIVSATNFENDEQCDKIKMQMNQVKTSFSRLGIDSLTHLLKTKNDIEVMANAINDYADDINADLIVIMTRQETKIQKFFVGSMAIKLIRKSSVPIMCIRPEV
jgi:nucleotide-binding universal stress UspA family protein